MCRVDDVFYLAFISFDVIFYYLHSPIFLTEKQMTVYWYIIVYFASFTSSENKERWLAQIDWTIEIPCWCIVQSWRWTYIIVNIFFKYYELSVENHFDLRRKM